MNKPYIIAVDFDGTLEDGAYPNIGTPNMKLIHILKILKSKGCELILWTCREGKELEEAVKWCESYNLHFDAINDNTERAKERWGNNPRKVGADYYIDDRNVGIRGLEKLIFGGVKLVSVKNHINSIGPTSNLFICCKSDIEIK